MTKAKAPMPAKPLTLTLI